MLERGAGCNPVEWKSKLVNAQVFVFCVLNAERSTETRVGPDGKEADGRRVSRSIPTRAKVTERGDVFSNPD